KLGKEDQPTLLLGVSFALIDLADDFSLEMKNTIVMETGGMKGRREELTRTELHERLCIGLKLGSIHSEYGMTELLSQAYAKYDGIFHSPPWMKVLIRDPYDPFSLMSRASSGGINIIDLANLYSCSFIATQDIGKITTDGGFEVLGRFDNSDIRGCNLMLE
ncbi:MAG: acyltransferase, partial [Bacteroidales bacterium]